MRHSVTSLAVAVALASMGLAATAQAGSVSTIWVNNATGGAPIIQEYNLTSGALMTQFNGDGYNGRGVVNVGNIVYYTTASNNNVYGYNTATNTDLGAIFSVSGANGLSTIAYDGTNFWIGDYSGTNQAYLYSMTGTLLKTVSLSQCTGYCDGLEYGTGVSSINGGKPFLISNRYDGGGGGANTYDIYDTNGNLITSNFITGHDSSGNTGIAFDGSTFYVDNIRSSTIGEYNTSGTWLQDLTLTGQNYFLGEDLSVNYAQVLPPAVPEPASWGVMLVGLVGLAGLAAGRRRTRA
ncbi:MAG: PEP-CTERM sorting domain-containing protein [Rhodospirillales bacterium]|jgi:MYXO-CTERM domain-containing protein|nr:PEP-CTERM sorting domain-containing protein [Rhodospirillales bacterium]